MSKAMDEQSQLGQNWHVTDVRVTHVRVTRKDEGDGDRASLTM